MPVSHLTALVVTWDPNLPFWKREGKNMSKSKFYTNIIHITYPSYSMHVFITVTSISVPLKRHTPKNRHPKYSFLLFFFFSFLLTISLFLWHVLYKTLFHKQQMDCCRFHLLVCMVEVLNTTGTGEGTTPVAVWRWGRCALCRSPWFLKSGTLFDG